jgi:hypothetical protein
MLNEMGALLKYEFRYYFRGLPLLYLVLMFIALIARFQMNFSGTDKTNLLLILYSIWIIVIAAMTVITAVYIILRFVNNFMKDQGALMFTLPVSLWTLVASKVIAALCMTLMSIASIVISALFFVGELGEEMTAFVSQTLNFPLPNFGEILIIFFLACVYIVHTTCLIYLAITISFLLPRFRFAAGCGIYIALGLFIEQPVYKFVGRNINYVLDYNPDATSISELGLAFGNDIYLSQISPGIAALAFAALYFFAIGFLLKRTFNLE